MSDIKIGFSGHESEFLNADDIITGDADVLTLFNTQFMKQYTKFKNLPDFVAAAGQDFNSQEAWNEIQDGKIDHFIKENSDFESWIDMYTTAGNEFLKDHLI